MRVESSDDMDYVNLAGQRCYKVTPPNEDGPMSGQTSTMRGESSDERVYVNLADEDIDTCADLKVDTIYQQLVRTDLIAVTMFGGGFPVLFLVLGIWCLIKKQGVVQLCYNRTPPSEDLSMSGEGKTSSLKGESSADMVYVNVAADTAYQDLGVDITTYDDLKVEPTYEIMGGDNKTHDETTYETMGSVQLCHERYV
ncbi:hypothetical protein DPEC_G00346110 [Dallia pectoralis]|uniref:Uncharacterized protein n=1 Tax=Dallia pectoralis TaxID=75939 RepID=A0ACC2F3Q5_DALPE|nr:hypothetical protein DPEC_G00346110 [Dallia pectoralis]